MLGYLYQARYALLRGLQEAKKHPSHELSIERFDDVSFEKHGRAIELIQTKHRIRQGDVSDKSVDLWKTLHLWITRITDEPTTVADARLILMTTNTAVDGSALALLRQTDGDCRDVEAALELLAAAAKESNNKATAAARLGFLSLTAARRRTLVGNIWVFDAAPNIVNVRDDIQDEIFYAAPPGRLQNLTDELEGWWINRTIVALAGRDTQTIHLAAIQNKVSELREMYKMSNLPLDDNIDTMARPATVSLADRRVFVRQMVAIRVPTAEVQATIYDYYRASAQRSAWAREDLLLGNEADRYDRALCDAWERVFLQYTASIPTHASESLKEAKGKKVFHWARRYPKPLRNRDELWLSSGSFQMLADDLRVGWHPDYKEMLGEEEE